MAEGTFRERGADSHVGDRRELLAGSADTPVVAATIIRQAGQAGDGVFASMTADLMAELARSGYAVVQLDRPLSHDSFLALGSLLGSPTPETDPAVQRYVQDAVVLNLVSEHDRTGDVNLQPFATNFLAVHSESSGRPAAAQPRYIVLMCCEPGTATAARTVLIPMAAVAAALTAAQREVLMGTRYRRNLDGPSILREQDGAPIFSFRDFMDDPLEWVWAGEPGEPAADAVNGAIRALLAAMYRPGVASAVRWRSGMIVVIDNTRYFHGRTAGAAAAAGQPRHLKRMRVAARADQHAELTWETATDPNQVHNLITASDSFHAATYGLGAPTRSRESTEGLVRAGAVQVLRCGPELVATFTITDRPPFAQDVSIFPVARRPLYLQRLAVEPHWLARTPLVGMRCLRRAVSYAAALGADALRSEANPDLEATAKLLAAVGFVRYGPVSSGGELRRVYLQLDIAAEPRTGRAG